MCSGLNKKPVPPVPVPTVTGKRFNGGYKSRYTRPTPSVRTDSDPFHSGLPYTYVDHSPSGSSDYSPSSSSYSSSDSYSGGGGDFGGGGASSDY